jgi:hypothetical protein
VNKAKEIAVGIARLVEVANFQCCGAVWHRSAPTRVIAKAAQFGGLFHFGHCNVAARRGGHSVPPAVHSPPSRARLPSRSRQSELYAGETKIGADR